MSFHIGCLFACCIISAEYSVKKQNYLDCSDRFAFAEPSLWNYFLFSPWHGFCCVLFGPVTRVVHLQSFVEICDLGTVLFA